MASGAMPCRAACDVKEAISIAREINAASRERNNRRPVVARGDNANQRKYRSSPGEQAGWLAPHHLLGRGSHRHLQIRICLRASRVLA